MRALVAAGLALIAATLGCGGEEEPSPDGAPATQKAPAQSTGKRRRHAGEAEVTAPSEALRKTSGGTLTLKPSDAAQKTGVDFQRDGPKIATDAADLRLAGGIFEAIAIADLGEVASLAEVPASAAQAHPLRCAAAMPRHLYLVRAHHPDRVIALRVTDLTADGGVTFDWTDEPVASDAASSFLVTALQLQVGDVVMQVRTNATPGLSRVTLDEPARWSRVIRSEADLDVVRQETAAESVAFVGGGPIPPGEAFIVESVDLYASGSASEIAGGGIALRVGADEVLRLSEVAAPGLQWFAGRAVAFKDREVALELGPSVAAEVRIHGRFVPVGDALRWRRAAFAPAPAPEGVTRAAGGPKSVRPFFLDRPYVLLQLRAGASGTPTRISMSGGRSRSVKNVAKRISAQPLPVDAPVAETEDPIAYAEGGLVPRGKVFVVTRVDYVGSAKGDAKGHGALVVSVMGTKIVEQRDAATPVDGSWTGRIEVPSGGEDTVVAEIGDSSALDVRIGGEFVNAPDVR